jgi:hypothetical protein
MWHIMEREMFLQKTVLWKIVSPNQLGYASFEEANKVMKETWYRGQEPQDLRFAVVMWPLG